MNIINLGILAHIDAGKTSVTENLLFASGATEKCGRVDNGDTITDSMDIEKRRGITVRASTTSIIWKGFTTQESINADRIVDYLDRFSFNVTKKTVIVLDNASVHRNRKVKELRKIWEKRGLYLFYLPPYSPELNPAEILWRILKGKWIRPIDYETTDSLFYCTNRALASVGTNLFVNYSYL